MRPSSTTITAQRGFDVQRGSSFLLLAALMLISALAVSGCNTVSGVGEDISAAGQGIDRTSEATQEKMSGKSHSQQQPSSTYQSGGY